MKQLTLGTLMQTINQLQKETKDPRELINIPVYIGNDDELNGIHTAWYAQVIDVNNEEDDGFVELINEDSNNIELQGKAILIS